MVNDKNPKQRTGPRRPWAVRALAAVTVLSACNAILDNDPRVLEPGGSAGRGLGAGGSREEANGGASEGGSPTAGTAASPGMCPGAAGEAGAPTCPPAGENCVPGTSASEDIPCGACDAGKATISHTCSPDGTWGPWSDPGACQVSVACTPGEPGTQTVPCGACMTGKVTQKRTCTDACTWGPWDAGGECTGVTAACVPGNKEPRTVSCPCSGTKTQNRTCSSACTWGAWSDTSTCNLECCTQLVYCDTPDDVATSRGTWCRRADPDCTNAEVDSYCKARVAEKCGSFTQPALTEY